MATETVAASGVTSPDNWTLAAGATKVEAVALPDDDGTSYITSTTTINTRQTFTCSPSVIATGNTITQIDVKARCVRGGASNVDFNIGYSFTPNGGGTQAGTSGTLTAVASQTNFTYTDSGLSVAWGSGLTIWIENMQARNMRCTTFYIILTYTAGPTDTPESITLARTVAATPVGVAGTVGILALGRSIGAGPGGVGGANQAATLARVAGVSASVLAEAAATLLLARDISTGIAEYTPRITRHNPQSRASATNASSYTLSYTVPSVTDRVLIVTAHTQYSSTDAFTLSATWGGAAMTQAVTETTTLSSPTRRWRTSIFYFINPSVTTANIVVSATVTPAGWVMGAVTLAGAAQVSPVGITDTDLGNPDSVLGLTGVSGDSMIIAAVTSNSTEPPTWSWTGAAEDYDLNNGAVLTEVAGSAAWVTAATAGDYTITGSRSASAAGQVGVAAEIKATLIATESLILARTLGTAGAATAATADALTLLNQLGVTFAEVMATAQAITLARTLGITQADAFTILEVVTLARTLGTAGAATAATADEIMTELYLELTATEHTAQTAAITAGREHGVTLVSVAATDDAAALGRILAIAIVDGGQAFAEAIALAVSRGVSVSDTLETIVNEAITLATTRTVTAGALAGALGAVALATTREATGAALAEALALIGLARADAMTVGPSAGLLAALSIGVYRAVGIGEGVNVIVTHRHIFVVDAENRVFIVDREDRTFIVESDND